MVVNPTLIGNSARFLNYHPAHSGSEQVIEIEVQNETSQTQQRLRFSAVPRIGEGIRLLGPDGFWASYDVCDVWYQKADYGDIWVPYLHVRLTAPAEMGSEEMQEIEFGLRGVNPFKI
jgi:hypothetical protein